MKANKDSLVLAASGHSRDCSVLHSSFPYIRGCITFSICMQVLAEFMSSAIFVKELHNFGAQLQEPSCRLSYMTACVWKTIKSCINK